MKKQNPTNEVLRHNYEDLQQKYVRMAQILNQLKDVFGYTGPINGLVDEVRKLKDKKNV